MRSRKSIAPEDPQIRWVFRKIPDWAVSLTLVTAVNRRFRVSMRHGSQKDLSNRIPSTAYGPEWLQAEATRCSRTGHGQLLSLALRTEHLFERLHCSLDSANLLHRPVESKSVTCHSKGNWPKVGIGHFAEIESFKFAAGEEPLNCKTR